jgi:ATP-dependent DNA ligase
MAKKKRPRKGDRVVEAPVPAEELKQAFPAIKLPVRPPFPPAEAKAVAEIPAGKGWLYEPKWDGFRCLAFRKDSTVLLQSKAGQPLGRYFPELVAAFAALPAEQFVLDGEIVITADEGLSFDDLLMRIHPAESRIRKLAAETPASFLAFDMLVDAGGKSLLEESLQQRRSALEEFFRRAVGGADIQLPPFASRGRKGRAAGPTQQIALSPATDDIEQARRWMAEGGANGLDGIVAKRADMAYASGLRTAMQKIKRIRTADCVVGGFRYASKGSAIGSLLLGVYNEAGQLDHIGFTASFSAEQRKQLKPIVERLRGGVGFSGKAPGGPSRWSTERSGEWERLQPKLVCEVRYDHFSGGRFRHGTKFLRWRPEKDPRQCTYEQVTGKRQRAA